VCNLIAETWFVIVKIERKMAIQGHVFWGQWKGDKALILYKKCWPHFLRCRRRSVRKSWKSTFLITLLSFDAPSPWNPGNIRTNLILPESRVIGLHLRRYSMGLFSLKLSWWAPKYARVLKERAKWPFEVIQGRWFWHQSKARMRLPIGHR